ncbi:hypothetical protein BGZ65_004991 [Modicella reniformis]|uniref:BAG domain-containing protein n=1 Tax=Modicella reniformis TaxID=1440133 RepID=A0A9P6M1X7_9FUNG|nr:hypothetical protein BGZ65_004991 [Modicella reniformis]
MITDSTKKTLIISVSAIVGLTTISALAYFLIQDDRRAKHFRKIRSLQKHLNHKLHKIETSVQELVEGDIRLVKVRTRTLRTHPIFPGDSHVQLPSLGLINEQDKIDFGEDIQETQEELILERSQSYGEDPQKVRQGYKRLDFLINSINERLLRLLESLDAISPRELTDLGDVSGEMMVAAQGPEMEAFEKIRKRKRNNIAKIQQLMVQMDKIASTFKDRLVTIETYEKEAEEKIAAEAAAARKLLNEALESVALEVHTVQDKHDQGHAAESSLVKEGLSFAEVASHHIKEQEMLVPNEVLHEDVDSGTTTTTISSSSSTSSSNSGETIVVDERERDHHLEKVQEGISFADVVSHNLDNENHNSESTGEQVLQQGTDDLERKKAETSFAADVVAHHTHTAEQKSEGEEEEASIYPGEKTEVLEPTEDLEKMKDGVSFADVVAKEPLPGTLEPEVPAAAAEVAAAH